ncbi:unnamed protein product [Rhizophagus irregularis]|nr:unnamed protein product [Rhizophagus irregularis]CAB5314020.1 unnamed protein product [Rhizophagus irregularis]
MFFRHTSIDITRILIIFIKIPYYSSGLFKEVFCFNCRAECDEENNWESVENKNRELTNVVGTSITNTSLN